MEQQWSRTITIRHDNYNTGDERKKTITIIVSMLLVFVIATLVIISHKIDNQKNTYYTVYQATQDCEVLEPIKFTIGAYHVCHVSRGDYIFSITSKSGRSYYFFEKNSELIKVKVDNDVACTFRCYGTITEFDYKYTDWEKRFSWKFGLVERVHRVVYSLHVFKDKIYVAKYTKLTKYNSHDFGCE